MKIFITGANGFIASQIVATLYAAGHEIICCVRNVEKSQQRLWYTSVIDCDFNEDDNPDIWIQRLEKYKIDCVINCAGVLQGSRKQVIEKIHRDTPIALFKACKQLKIKRVIQISALGAGEIDTSYAKTKNAADEYLLSLTELSSLVIRPSVVYASGSYGGTSLFRGLCALPWFIPLVGNGKQLMDPIYLPDLAKAILHYIENPETSGKIIYAVGGEQVSQKDLLIKLRKWLGFSKAICIGVPKCLIAIVAKFGDFFVRSPVNSTTLEMLEHGNTHAPEEFLQSVPFKIKSISEALQANSSSTQDRWHARLYFLRPLLRFSLALLWLVSGLIPLLNPEQSLAMLGQVGLPIIQNNITLYSLAGLDIFIGLAVLARWRCNLIGKLQFFIVLAYTLIVSITLTNQWLHPFGPILKNIPILVAILIWTVIEDDR